MIRKDIEQLEAALAKAEEHSKQIQTLMIKRLRAMYKFGYDGGQLSYLKLLLGADDISDLMSRYKYMSAIADGDRKLLEEAIAVEEEIDSKKKQKVFLLQEAPEREKLLLLGPLLYSMRNNLRLLKLSNHQEILI